jgi:ATP-dependent protease HslVU (ClpYQ) peptidase subunit
VTVCIAGLCDQLSSIVAVSDEMITFGDVSVDRTAEKISPLHRSWFAMYAANDITDVRPILDKATFLICAAKRERSMTEVGEAFQTAYATRHEQLIEHRLLIPNGFRSLDDFHLRGKESLTVSQFNRLSRCMRTIKPECKFLIGGFDLMGIGHLLVQEANSPYQCYDDPGFWAIGSGQNEAISSMIFQADKLGFGMYSSEALCIFHLLVAKFMAESNKLVGRETSVVVHARGEQPRYLMPEDVAKVRTAWEEHFLPRAPVELIEQLPNLLVTGDGKHTT